MVTDFSQELNAQQQPNGFQAKLLANLWQTASACLVHNPEFVEILLPCAVHNPEFAEVLLPCARGVRFLRSLKAAPDCKASSRLSITPVSSPSESSRKTTLNQHHREQTLGRKTKVLSRFRNAAK